MATDGVKIIDGDLAHDTYYGIMDLYDNDANIQTIRHNIPFVKTDLGDDMDFYHEIFVTAYALALWEIGELTDDITQAVQEAIVLQAGVTVWSLEVNKREGEKRQKELDKLWDKISKPNLKIRKRKKYRLISKLFFQPDYLLTFQTKDGKYHAVVCANVTQHRGQCTYDLVTTTYSNEIRPTETSILDYFIAGRKIGSGYSPKVTLEYQPGVDEIWRFQQNETHFFFGVTYHLVTHKDFIHFVNKFEKVGTLRIKESFKKSGGYGYESDFERFETIFGDLDNYLHIFKQDKYPVRLLCEL